MCESSRPSSLNEFVQLKMNSFNQEDARLNGGVVFARVLGVERSIMATYNSGVSTGNGQHRCQPIQKSAGRMFSRFALIPARYRLGDVFVRGIVIAFVVISTVHD